MIRTKLISILLVMYVTSIFSLTAQEAMIIDPSGNVGINTNTPIEKLDVNGNVNVEGTLNTNGNIISAGEVQAQNLVLNEEIILTGTYPTIGTTKYLPLPEGFNAVNSFIISAKVRSAGDDSFWYNLPLPHRDEYGLRIAIDTDLGIWMQNDWSSTHFNNAPVIFIIGRVEGITY